MADWLAHDVTIRAVDCGAITPQQIPEVLQEWRNPGHDDFAPRNAWSLFNAFTEAYKTVNPHTALRRGEALHGLFDGLVGLNGRPARASDGKVSLQRVAFLLAPTSIH